MGVIVREKIRGSGEWWVFINHHGHRKAKKIGDKKAAKEIAAKLEARIASGDLKIDEKPAPIFNDLAREWITITVPATCKASTLGDYERILKNHVGPAFNNRQVDQITRLEVKDFLLSKIRDGLAPSTITHMKNVISGVLSRALEAGVIDNNPALNLGRLFKSKPRGQDINPFTWEELDELLETFARKWPRYYPLILCLARTGLCFGEAAALTWDDIDFQARAIHVRRGLSRMQIVTPKSGKTRTVDMSRQLAGALQAVHTEKKREALAAGVGRPTKFVFTNRSGGLVDINHFRARVWNKALKAAKLTHHRIHDLRHTYATLRISKGDNIADVSNQLGHHSIKLTLDQYYHWLPGKAKNEVDALDNRPADIRPRAAK